VDVVLFARMVGKQTAARACSGANDSALRSAYKSAHNRTTYRRSSHDLGLRVVLGIMLLLNVLGMFVLITVLGPHAQRQHEHGCYNYLSHKSFHHLLSLKIQSHTILQNHVSQGRLFYLRPTYAMPLKPASDALKKTSLADNLLHFFEQPVYLEGDAFVVHRVLRFSVPLLVDSSGRGD
jgi:hypothetical protein